jgi:hypothetical protein
LTGSDVGNIHSPFRVCGHIGGDYSVLVEADAEVEVGVEVDPWKKYYILLFLFL